MDILKRIAAGEPNATRSFYQQYSPKILVYLQKRLAHPEDAQELMQDVFFEAIDSLLLFENRSSVMTWLYSIARHKVVDYYRKKKIKAVLLSTVPFLQIASVEMNEPEFQFEKNKIRDRIEKAFATLSPRNQAILLLRYEEGNSVKQIALLLNLSMKAAESLLFRARHDFKRAYERA